MVLCRFQRGAYVCCTYLGVQQILAARRTVHTVLASAMMDMMQHTTSMIPVGEVHQPGACVHAQPHSCSAAATHVVAPQGMMTMQVTTLSMVPNHDKLVAGSVDDDDHGQPPRPIAFTTDTSAPMQLGPAPLAGLVPPSAECDLFDPQGMQELVATLTTPYRHTQVNCLAKPTSTHGCVKQSTTTPCVTGWNPHCGAC